MSLSLREDALVRAKTLLTKAELQALGLMD